MKAFAVSAAITTMVAASCGGHVISNTAALAEALYRVPAEGRVFDVTATVTSSMMNGRMSLALQDDSGAVIVQRPKTSDDISPGDVVRVRGETLRDGYGMLFANAASVVFASHGKPQPPIATTTEDFHSGRFDGCLLSVEGMVIDAFRDEIDPLWIYLALRGKRDVVFLTFASTNSTTKATELIGSDVIATGICTPVESGERHHLGRILKVDSVDGIHTVRANEDKVFSAPDLDDIRSLYASEITALGRCRASGMVLAVWQKKNFLLKTCNGRIVRVSLLKGSPPSPGDGVDAIGFPETDLYRINLSQSIWRSRPNMTNTDAKETPISVSVRELMTDDSGNRRISARFHGRTIRICGVVKGRSVQGQDTGRLLLESDGFIIPIEVSGAPETLVGIEPECTVSVTGVCLMDSENWRLGETIPRISSVAVVVRSADDLRILSRPPWWTLNRILSAMGLLVLGLLCILAWNMALRKAVARRSHELVRTQVAKIGSDLRVEERTRLAADLHDYVAQSLSSVSMQIDAAMRMNVNDRGAVARCLGLASKTLDACRTELRTCLWDLRSQAFEAPDMNTAIMLSTKPVIGDTALEVHFDISRRRISDNTAHALLRIVGELTSNAVIHGRAKKVKVSARPAGDAIILSVADDGCGFDVDSCPGIYEGHFGLQGVRDRIRRFGGSLSIESTCGAGTTATVVLHLSDEGKDYTP